VQIGVVADGDDGDSCLLPFRAATGTPFLRAEESMHYEGVISHAVAQALSWQNDIATFSICCLLSQYRFLRARHM
jgi:hypothetical protein